MEKQCSRCPAVLPLESFPVARTCADGHLSYCRECKRAEDREYSRYRRDRRRQRENQRRWKARVKAGAG